MIIYFDSTAPAPHARVDQELHHMKNPSYSNLWWHSFWKEEVAIHISKWSTSLSVSQRDGRSKDEIEQKKTDEISIKREKQRWRCFGLRTWKTCCQSMTKRRCCSSKRTFHIYKLLINLWFITNQIAQYDRDRSLPTPVSFPVLDYKKNLGFPF